MGAVPKKKPSLYRSRRRRRAYTKKLSTKAFVTCPDCKASKLSHRVCPDCGKYRGLSIIEPKTKVRRV